MFRCFRTTLRKHVEPAFGWNEERQRAGFALKFNREEWAVLTVDGVFGGLAWMECGDEWALRLISIQPEYQSLGIGQSWLQYIQARAREEKRRVRLKVFQT
ncbi:MAG: GNAT family N-acetyltransferase, partial [Acidihalobacter sp.]